MLRYFRLGVIVVILSCLLLALTISPLDPPSLTRPHRPVTIVITGDILLRSEKNKIGALSNPNPFFGVQSILRDADLAIGNLECVLSRKGTPAKKRFTFRADPSCANQLETAGYDVITLANNHSGDYGPEALLDTIRTLRKHHIQPVGAGENLKEARRFLLIKQGHRPLRIAVLAFSNMKPTSFYAGAVKAGANPAWASYIKQDITLARAQADLVIALFHWGKELSVYPSKTQRYLADIAVGAGADLVVGHHPHVLQGIEQRGNALIAYSLGNFAFPSRGATRDAIMLRCIVSGPGKVRTQVIPCMIEDRNPRIARGQERSRILAQIADLSKTKVKRRN